PVLSKIGADPESLAATVDREIGALPKQSGGGMQQPGLSRAASSVLERAFKEADQFKDEYVSTEHLLLAIADEKGDAAQRTLVAAGATRGDILHTMPYVRGNQRVHDETTDTKYM